MAALAAAAATWTMCCRGGALYVLPGQQLKDVGGARRSLLLANSLLAAGFLSPEDASALTDEEIKATNLFKNCAPSVLCIGEAPRHIGAKVSPAAIAGSGFIWDDRHVVTNYHVIDDLKSPHVTFVMKEPSTGAVLHTVVSTTVVGADPLSDIAVLEVAVTDDPKVLKLMRPLSRGQSSDLHPGQNVFALGNPLGLEQSMSRGVISGLSRTLEGALGRPISGIIQTDASINPGNSGGPLLDSEGRVVGMNAAIISTSGLWSGIGMAIPIDTLQTNVNSMIEIGFVSRPSLGIVFAPDALTEELGLSGPMVMKVFPGSPASKAGLRAMRKGRIGDVITSFAGRPVASPGDIFQILEDKAPGDNVALSVKRASLMDEGEAFDEIDITVRLGNSNSKIVVT